jgi:hypothetical protein
MRARRLFLAFCLSAMALSSVLQPTMAAGQTMYMYGGSHRHRHHWNVVGRQRDGSLVLQRGRGFRRETMIVPSGRRFGGGPRFVPVRRW